MTYQMREPFKLFGSVMVTRYNIATGSESYDLANISGLRVRAHRSDLLVVLAAAAIAALVVFRKLTAPTLFGIRSSWTWESISVVVIAIIVVVSFSRRLLTRCRLLGNRAADGTIEIAGELSRSQGEAIIQAFAQAKAADANHSSP